MQCASGILSYVTSSVLPYIPTLSHKGHNFIKKIVKHKMCVLVFFTSFVQNIYHCKKNEVIYDKKNVIGLRVKYALFLSDLSET
jgi:predicted SprT family Zn-dependent metalloprotease